MAGSCYWMAPVRERNSIRMKFYSYSILGNYQATAIRQQSWHMESRLRVIWTHRPRAAVSWSWSANGMSRESINFLNYLMTINRQCSAPQRKDHLRSKTRANGVTTWWTFCICVGKWIRAADLLRGLCSNTRFSTKATRSTLWVWPRNLRPYFWMTYCGRAAWFKKILRSNQKLCANLFILELAPFLSCNIAQINNSSPTTALFVRTDLHPHFLNWRIEKHVMCLFACKCVYFTRCNLGMRLNSAQISEDALKIKRINFKSTMEVHVAAKINSEVDSYF